MRRVFLTLAHCHCPFPAQGSSRRALQVIVQGLRFGFMSGSVFVGLHLLFSRLYGEPYVQEALLHHLTRKDHRSGPVTL